MSKEILYIELLKKCLINLIYSDYEMEEFFPSDWKMRLMQRYLKKRGGLLMKNRVFNKTSRIEGKDWPPFAHSMIGLKRLNNIQNCVDEVIKQNVPGDFIETGVWRGGSTIFMRGILKAYDISDRKVWVADSFQGLPPPDPKNYPADFGDIHHSIKFLAVSLEEVQENFRKYDLLDDQVKFLKGWFKDTLFQAPIERLAILRLDGDMYSSTIETFNALYSKVSPGGFIIVDDYCLQPCRKAVQDFREKHFINDEIILIDEVGAFWRKSN